MSTILHLLKGGPAAQTLPPSHPTQDDSLQHKDAAADTDIAYVLSEHACEPLDSEIERIESILASCPRRRRLQEVCT